MQRLNDFVYTDPLDVLRRFVPTPLKAVYHIGSQHVAVETNDITLFPSFPLETDPHSPCECDVQWKLIRDLDAPGLLAEPVFLNCGTLTVVEMGTACFLGFDHERRELLGFIGADIDARTHQEFLVPFLSRITSEALSRVYATETLGFPAPGLAND